MKIKQISYPHPVLAPFNDDYTDSKFEASLEYDIGETSTNFKITYNLKNKDIQYLIDTGNAVFVTHIECTSSMYRKAFSSKSSNSEFTVPNRKLSTQADVTFMVVTTTEIDNYTNSLLHEDYEGSLLRFKKGAYIAVHQGGTLILEKNPLVPAKSIFNIVESDKENTLNYSLNFSNDIISISLPKETYKVVNKISSYEEVNPLLISMYYLPALMEALMIIVTDESDVDDNDDRYDEKEWYKSLQLHLKRMNITENEIKNEGFASISNKILAEIFDKAVNSLNSIYLSSASSNYSTSTYL